MLYRALADFVIVVHFAFIAFVVTGALLLLWKRVPRWVALVHIACVAWGGFVMFTGSICPLTPLENRLRALGGEAGYQAGFIERYLLALIYPEGLTRETQLWLGVAVLALNAFAYALLIWRKTSRSLCPK